VSCSGKAVEEAVSTQILQTIETTTIDAAIAAAQRAGERRSPRLRTRRCTATAQGQVPAYLLAFQGGRGSEM
jgi:hypothetical protein